VSIFKRLVSFLRQPWRMVLLAVSLGWATTVSWMALISTSAYLISFAALQPSIAELQVAIVGVRFFGIARAGLRYLERLVSHTVTFRLLARLRTWLYERIEPQAPAGLTSQRSGDLLSTIVADIETLQEFYVRIVAPPVVALLSSVGVLWFFGRWSGWFAVIILGFQLLAGVAVPLAVRRLGSRPGTQIGLSRAAQANMIVDGLQGSAEVLAFNLSGRMQAELDKLVAAEARAESRQNLVLGGHAAVVGLSVNLMSVILLGVAIPMVSNGSLDGRLLAVVVLGAIASFESILPLPQAFQNLEESLQAGKRIFELADRPPLVTETGADPERTSEPHLLIKKLTFAYRQVEKPVLTDLDLDLPAGKKVAILGPSGSGKSTIANLLLRFWDYRQGEILWSGANLRTLDAAQIRAQISYLPQNPFVFNTTITENILLGRPNASWDEIIAAARAVDLDDFIQSLPQKYDTLAGEFGILLSGGQRQRLALARAFVRDAPVYLLDEPTANLDPVTANEITRSVLAQVAGKSLIWISHRLTGLESMDEIIILREGRVIERGTHAELVSRKTYYSRLHRSLRDSLE